MRDWLAGWIAALLPRRVIGHAYARVLAECVERGQFDTPDFTIEIHTRAPASGEGASEKESEMCPKDGLPCGRTDCTGIELGVCRPTTPTRGSDE